jgi:hypothetical protein
MQTDPKTECLRNGELFFLYQLMVTAGGMADVLIFLQTPRAPKLFPENADEGPMHPMLSSSKQNSNVQKIETCNTYIKPWIELSLRHVLKAAM